MANYAKMWTDQWEDEWWVSLKCIERGLYDQMITWAKKSGDTGRILFRNYMDFSNTFGIDYKTGVKIIGKFQEKSKIKIERGQGVLIIDICNYIKNQQLKRTTDKKEIGNPLEKSTLNKEKIREDKREAGSSLLKLQEIIGMTEFNKAVRGHDPVKWIETLVNEYGYDEVQAKVDALDRNWKIKGLRPPGSPEKARDIIAAEFKQREVKENVADRIAASIENS